MRDSGVAGQTLARPRVVPLAQGVPEGSGPAAPRDAHGRNRLPAGRIDGFLHIPEAQGAARDAAMTPKSEGDAACLFEAQKLVLKAYSSPDGKIIRIVLPELVGYGQIKHFVDGKVKFIQFYRDPKTK
jgi:hypothetical protein